MHLLQECRQGYRVIAMELSNFVHRTFVALSMILSLDPPIWISICINFDSFNEAISPEEKCLQSY